MEYFFIIFCIVALYLIIKCVLNPYIKMRSFKNIKGCTMAKFIPIIGPFKDMQQNFKKYGDTLFGSKQIFKLFPDSRIVVTNLLDKALVVLLDPKLIEEFFQKQEKYIKYKFFTQNKVKVFGQSTPFAEGKIWAKRRKIISQVFHYGFYQDFIPIIEHILSEQLEEVSKIKILDANKFGSTIAGEAILSSFFGVKCKDKINGQSITSWVNTLISEEGAQQKQLRFFLFGSSILKLGLFKQDRVINNKIKLYKQWIKQQIQKIITNNKPQSKELKQSLLINTLISKGLLNTEEGLTTQQIAQELMAFFAAGTDTTSHLITFSLYYLTNFPEVQQRLRQELNNSQITNPKTTNDYNSYEFLQAFIKETFRHSGYMNSFFPRQSTVSHTIGQITIPQGVLILPGWIQNSYRQSYYENADKFNPQRWIKCPNLPSPYILTPFSIGSRVCLGKTFALIQVKMVLISLIKRFQLRIQPGYVHRLNFKSLYGPQNPIIVQLEPINSNPT